MTNAFFYFGNLTAEYFFLWNNIYLILYDWLFLSLRFWFNWKNFEERIKKCKFYCIYIFIFLFEGNPVSGKRVVYGCTQLCSADQFLDQIKQLGTEIWSINQSIRQYHSRADINQSISQSLCWDQEFRA